jgi:hypothetical protein
LRARRAHVSSFQKADRPLYRPGRLLEKDPEGIIFDRGMRLRVELNHWRIFCFLLAAIAGAAVWTR